MTEIQSPSSPPGSEHRETRTGATAPASTDPLAAHAPTPGLLADYWDFLKSTKKWWLTPILMALLLVGLLVFLSASGVGPALYPFF